MYSFFALFSYAVAVLLFNMDADGTHGFESASADENDLKRANLQVHKFVPI